ncbi:hypothetical protein [Streptomyces albidocamelliae]|uniref:hypothetical protein n=1 Tax=Streptomyces albidocamelliae TaxID=2981135 RepID=UPI00384D820B
MTDAIAFKYRTGTPSMDLPERFGWWGWPDRMPFQAAMLFDSEIDPDWADRACLAEFYDEILLQDTCRPSTAGDLAVVFSAVSARIAVRSRGRGRADGRRERADGRWRAATRGIAGASPGQMRAASGVHGPGEEAAEVSCDPRCV